MAETDDFGYFNCFKGCPAKITKKKYLKNIFQGICVIIDSLNIPKFSPNSWFSLFNKILQNNNTCILYIFYIIRLSSHVGGQVGSLGTYLELETPRMIVIKFGSN